MVVISGMEYLIYGEWHQYLLVVFAADHFSLSGMESK